MNIFKKLGDYLKASVFRKLLRSRKTWLSIITAVVGFGGQYLDIDTATMIPILMAFVASILGTSWEDGKMKSNPNWVPPNPD